MSAVTLAQGSQISAPDSIEDSSGHKPPRKRRRGSIAEKDGGRSDSIVGALTRSILGVVALLFRAPIRLYRPVKLSSWSILETLAKREGKTLNLRFLRSIIRREKGSFLLHLLGPPLLFNTLIGVALFETYSLTESYLLHKFYPNRPGPRRDSAGRRIPQWSPFWVVGISGLAAGAGQALVSAPLDNVRTILSARPPSHGHGKQGGQHHHRAQISWRAVLRAALLPFAPESTRKMLVKQVKSDTPKTRWSWLLPSQIGSSGTKITAKQRREYWEAQLKRWRGGIHGAGLVLSLVRDSVGFSAFFVLFEISRRVAYSVSIEVDKVYLLFNRSPTLPPTSSPADLSEESIDIDDVKTDYSYCASRSIPGRLIAAFILICGGAIGAASYELLGRPAELMRTVIWEGRKAWEQGRERKRASRPAGRMKVRVAGAHGRSSLRGARIAASRAHGRHFTQQTPFIELRKGHTGGTLTTRISGLTGLHGPPHPLRTSKKRTMRAGSHPKLVATHARRAERSAKLPRRGKHFIPPTLQNRPSAWTLLREHAMRTSSLRLTSSSPKARLSPTPVPLPILLLHTYFIAPFFPHRPKSYVEEQRSSPSAESVMRKRWTLNNPVNTSNLPGSIRTIKNARQWGSGRFSWILRKLATQYGVGFVAFAYLGGDLAS